jgi:type III restriction enzyme
VKYDDETLYLIRETKGVRKEQLFKLRTSEADKIRCGEKHFEALGLNFDVAVDANEV